MENNYGIAVFEFDEEEDCYRFFKYGGQASKEEAEKALQFTPHGGYLIKLVPCIFRGVKTSCFEKA